MKSNAVRQSGKGMATLCLAAVGMLLAGGWVRADGFRNPPEGATALGRGGVRLTQADDATTVTHNPANLVDLKESSVMGTLTIGYVKRDYTSPQGVSEETKNPWRVLPAVYAAWPMKDGDYVLGLGIHVPYGQSTQWDDKGAFRYAPYFAEMKTLNLNPTVATRLGERLQAGVGVDVMQSDLKFRQHFPFRMITGNAATPDSLQTFCGDGVGIGANAGLTWLISPRQRLAVVYRSPIQVEYEGDFTMDNVPAAGQLPPPLAGLSSRSDFKTEIDFPTTVGLGYGIQATDDLRLEANVEWMEHSRNQSMELDIGNNNALLMAALNTTSLKQNWDDTWTVGVGADWRMATDWTLRAGWFFLPTPVPDATFMPSVAEGDQNVVSLGVGFDRDAHRIDIAYAASVIEDRDIRNSVNPALNGEYESESHLIGLSYGYSF